jgi:hypothetical protein
MRVRPVYVLIFLGVLFAFVLAGLPTQFVSAQGCYDPRTGKQIPCPQPEEPSRKKRTPTETPQRPTKTPTSTPTATQTNPVLAYSPPLILTSAALTSAALTSQAPTVANMPLNNMPPWLLAGGLLGALVLVFLIGVLRGGAQPGAISDPGVKPSGGEKIDPSPHLDQGIGDPGIVPPPEGDLGGPDTIGDPGLSDPPEPSLGGPDT